MTGYLDTYGKILIVSVDNVKSKQMQEIRHMLRHRAELLMGKNTLMRKCLRDLAEQRPDEAEYFLSLVENVKSNIGLLFTDMEVADVVEVMTSNFAAAPAASGRIAPEDIFVEVGPTGMDAQKTSFFQALNLATKIVKGDINILARTKIMAQGDKVGPSEAKLINMLGISPFSFGLKLEMIAMSGAVFPPSVLDIKMSDLIAHVCTGLANIASVGLALKLPNKASAPHSIVNGFKLIMAACLGTDTLVLETDGFKNAKLFLTDPEAWGAANAGGGGGGGGDAPAETAAAAPAEAAKEESEADSDESMDGGLFD